MSSATSSKAAANHRRDRFRRASVRPSIDYEGAADVQDRRVEGVTPERERLAREAYAVVVSALQALPERPRMILILNRYEEMTGREIAAILGAVGPDQARSVFAAEIDPDALTWFVKGDRSQIEEAVRAFGLGEPSWSILTDKPCAPRCGDSVG